MKLGKYLADKALEIGLCVAMYVIILLMMLAFKCDISLIAAITLVMLVTGVILVCHEYYRRRNFYEVFLDNLKKLDKKYLVSETVNQPSFYEGKILVESLYEIDKSMCENVKMYESNINDFKDYVEMWIHEVKIPIASLVLMAHNHREQFDTKAVAQIRRVDNYLEQILYYVRSENAEKDYLIKETSLAKAVSDVAVKNKDDLLDNNVSFSTEGLSQVVLTDGKWLEFMLNQLVNNSIKYRRDSDAQIKVAAKENNKNIELSVWDNGIGIQASDLYQVFDKSFTGKNGRIRSKSTGMGLYIVKKLCDKLGHRLAIDSVEGSYTCVKITFSRNEYFDVVK